ncbi:SCAN domain-containing protein 3 [Dictyocoela muelleri]|nr:SCAN domain-containing protein 3 [Dictyocoela muelleri]
MFGDLTKTSNVQYQEELTEIQNDEFVRVLFEVKGKMAWLGDEIKAKYKELKRYVSKLFLPFPSSYLYECGLSTINNLLSKKINRLNITQGGDLRLKLTELESNIKEIISKIIIKIY